MTSPHHKRISARETGSVRTALKAEIQVGVYMHVKAMGSLTGINSTDTRNMITIDSSGTPSK